ncbi:hypothetical protein KLEP7_gp82 [Pseudaeromonas phage vB_PpeM_ KLEP7]|nr:hypothetical protein KLEP7_gp82 [Pseudaeromonas phage vB_PpeM_ KLEP7]
MAKCINHEKLSPTIEITECKDGWWLWDETRGMNLGMREKTRDEAFISALEYYQQRLIEVETEHKVYKIRLIVFFLSL